MKNPSFLDLMNICVIDNVLSDEDFQDYKNRVDFARFGDVISQGIKYSDVSQDVSADKVYDKVSKVFRPCDGKVFAKSFQPKNVLSFLRAYRNRPEYRHPMWIHSDALFADYIGVYFVRPSEFPQDDGFSLWRNKELNTFSLDIKDHTDPKAKVIDSQTLDPEKWELWHRVEFKPNRLVICPASYFHSTTTYGHHGGVDDCRIVHVLFFNKDD